MMLHNTNWCLWWESEEVEFNGNAIAQKIQASFQDDGREVPSSLRITYEPKAGKLNSTMSYDKLLDDEDADSLTMYFRWFAEEGGALEPWQMI